MGEISDLINCAAAAVQRGDVDEAVDLASLALGVQPDCAEALLWRAKAHRRRGNARAALGDGSVKIGRILHPSPASPAANKDWAGQAEKSLRDMDLPVGG